jgi:hypothetical protein
LGAGGGGEGAGRSHPLAIPSDIAASSPHIDPRLEPFPTIRIFPRARSGNPSRRKYTIR